MSAKHVFSGTAAGFLVVCCLGTSWSQEFTSNQRDQVQAMLRDVASDVNKHYYDPQFHGVDWDSKVHEAKEKIDKSESMNRALSHIAAALDSLHDSHTFFLPPPRPYLHDYGFQMQMIGDHCYVIRVRPGSDAETKGLKSGDEILAVNGYTPTRDDFWRIEFVYKVLRPQLSLRLNLRTEHSSERQVDVVAKFRELPQVKDATGSGIFDIIREMENQASFMRVRYAEKGDDLLIVKLPAFVLSPSDIDSVIGKMRKHRGVVIDLRSNPGGSVETLRSLLGGMFENKVKIGDRLGRSSTKPLETQSHHHGFTGSLVVLVDSKSGSAAELFARVIQIEKRGSVVGDHSSGSVMEAQHYSHKVGIGTVVFYGASITEADFKMADGQSLEHKGVVPDTLTLPTAADLAGGRDPVITQAALMLNVKISPEEAGTLFPYEWPKE